MEKCNDWECKHNKNGECETIEAFSACLEEVLKDIKKIEKK